MTELAKHPAPANPWGLSPKQCMALDAVLNVGTVRDACADLDMDPHTANTHLMRAKAKMGVPSTILAAVHWDRFKHREALTRAFDEAGQVAGMNA